MVRNVMYLFLGYLSLSVNVSANAVHTQFTASKYVYKVRSMCKTHLKLDSLRCIKPMSPSVSHIASIPFLVMQNGSCKTSGRHAPLAFLSIPQPGEFFI